MQKWTRQSQCILCQFRATSRRQRPQYNTRTYRVPAIRAVDLQERSDRRQDGPRRSSKHRIDFRRDSKDTVPIDRRKRVVDLESEKKHAESRRREIELAMKRVKAGYMQVKMSKNSEVSQLKGLDPDGTLWPQFEAMITELLDAAMLSRRKRSAGVLAELMKTKQDDATFNAERTLQFAFLDFVLDHGDPIQTGGSYTADLRYPTEWYPITRQLQRVVHLHVGPTNSGKTYTALKRLEQARDGFYAGPLRLLAHEVYSRFNSRGIKCDLVTGDDVRQHDAGDVRMYASTVEMVDSGRVSEVGVIDEIQMMGDNQRGWAWTRAVLGAKAKELHLCGEARVVPLIREIVASMGDTLHIHQYERLNPLKVMSRSLKGNLKNLRPGDCVVSFSIMNIHALKRQIEIDTGRHCAIVYGSLPPETRAQQAALFNDPNNDYDFLVASDAIGMGLNLSIKRVVFETTMKFNGTFRERLSIPQMKQIAGRAGRYRTARDDSKTDGNTSNALTKSSRVKDKEAPKSIGLVTCLDEADLPVLQHALDAEGPPLKAAGVLPPGEFYEELAARLPEDTPFEYLLRRMNSSVTVSNRFILCETSDQLQIARMIEEVKGLSIATRLTLCAAPCSWSASAEHRMRKVMLALARAIAEEKGVSVCDFEEIPLEVLDDPLSSDRAYLTSLENLHKSLILYLWLSYRFPRVLRDQEMAIRAKELCEEKINTTLLKFSANPKLVARLAEIRKSSELLRDQAREKGLPPPGATLTMNPDKTVEEHTQEVIDQESDATLERAVEVEGELDIGDEDTVRCPALEKDGQLPEENLDDFSKDVDESQRASGSG